MNILPRQIKVQKLDMEAQKSDPEQSKKISMYIADDFIHNSLGERTDINISDSALNMKAISADSQSSHPTLNDCIDEGTYTLQVCAEVDERQADVEQISACPAINNAPLESGSEDQISAEALARYRNHAEQKKQKSMTNGANLLTALKLSKGKVEINQLKREDIDDMTICLGGKPLASAHKKILRVEKLEALIQKSSEITFKSGEACSASVPDHVPQQENSKRLSAIENVCGKYGSNAIAKMLAERLVRPHQEADDLFTRIQIMDMLALVESSFQKPSMFTRNLHELSVNPTDNREKLAVRMDQIAELIDKAMVPINESILLVGTGSRSPKKRGRLSADQTH